MTRRGRMLLALSGLCILAALLYFAGGHAVLDAMRRCTPHAVAGAAASIIAGTFVGAWNVYCIAGLKATMPFRRFLSVYWRSWAVGITLPGQVADMLTTLWQLKRRTGNLAFIAGRLFADKAITFAAMLALAALLPWMLDPARMFLSLVLLAALALAALAALMLAHWCVRHPSLLKRWRWSARLQPIVAAAVDLPFNAALLNLGLTVAKILLTGLAYWLLLRAIAPAAPRFSTTTVISQSAGLIAYIPISFNGIGTVEVSAIALFRTAGIGSAVVLSAYLVVRAITLLAAWLPAAWWLLRRPAPPHGIEGVMYDPSAAATASRTRTTRMREIEPAQREATPGLTGHVSDFWTRNVNAERIMGLELSTHERGSEGYFRDLEDQRYRSHRHLPAWISLMQPGAQVLEVGCGIGLDSARMVRQGLQVTAADLTLIGASTAADRARAQGWDANYVCANGEQLPFADASFDYVYSFGVMHHAADTQRCVDEAHRVLRDGGQALIMLYHRHSLNELVHRLLRVPFEERDELCPVVRRFTKKDIRRMFAGFRSVQVHSDFVFGEGYAAVYRMTPRPLYQLLSRLLGWHLMIRATR